MVAKLRASNAPSFIQIQGEEGERLSLRAWDEHILIVRVLRPHLIPLPRAGSRVFLSARVQRGPLGRALREHGSIQLPAYPPPFLPPPHSD